MIVVKPHLGECGGVKDHDSGLDAVWLVEPGGPAGGLRIALAHRQPNAAVIGLVSMSELVVGEVRRALRDRPCEQPGSQAIADLADAQADNRTVIQPPEELAEDADEEDDDS